MQKDTIRLHPAKPLCLMYSDEHTFYSIWRISYILTGEVIFQGHLEGVYSKDKILYRADCRSDGLFAVQSLILY